MSFRRRFRFGANLPFAIFDSKRHPAGPAQIGENVTSSNRIRVITAATLGGGGIIFFANFREKKKFGEG